MIRKMIFTTSTTLLLLLLVTLARAQDHIVTHQGIWSAKGNPLKPDKKLVDNMSEGILITSPTGRYAFHLTLDDLVEVRMSDLMTRKKVGEFTLASLDLTEILWASDDKAFALTQSDGGLVGTWNIAIGTISEFSGSLSFFNNIDKFAMADFRTRILPKECANEYPNMAAVAWVDSNKLLIVGEVPPHSSCKMMGTYFGYIVDIPSGKILSRIDEGTLSTKWKSDLGSRLKK